MPRKTRVAVLMGGMSAEREISLKTGAKVAAALDRAAFEVTEVRITAEGRWRIGDGAEAPLHEALALLGGPGGAEVVFVALHGTWGEDGAVQGLLEWAGIPYTGSGILGSALAMDKERSRIVLRSRGLPVPRSLAFGRDEWKADAGGVAARIAEHVASWPVVVKPTEQGSSQGVHIVRSREDLAPAVEDAFRFGPRLLAEEFLEGDEATCAVLDTPGGGAPEALPPTQIIPRTSSWFDFTAKYTPGATEEVTPARFPQETNAALQRIAVEVHQSLGLAGMSRTDFIVARGTPYVLEANTIPGMTETSLLPQAAAVAGIEFPRLLERIVRLGIEQSARRRVGG